MNQSNRISARALLAVATMAFSPAAWSLGLGDATVESYLNQPLQARIDLISNESDDLRSVTAKLASAADYELIGASLEDISVPIRFTVEDIDGDAYLVASSSLPVNNPIVRLIVEVSWSSGRMLREYTLFLDPPMVEDVAPAQQPLPRVDLRESAPPATAPQPPAAEPQVSTTPAPAQASQPAPARTPSAGEYGPVASGETLWGIARDWARGTGLDTNKVMIAIQRENPTAFMNDNINLLKRGAILRMPEVSEVERISRAEAYNEVVEQEQEFTGRRTDYGVTSPSTPLLAEESAPLPEPAAPEPEMPAEDLYSEPEPESAEASGPEAVDAATPADPAEGESAESEAASEPVADIAAAAAEEALEPAGQLELVPPSEASELDSTYGFEETEDDGDASVATQALRENLARTEEELIAEQAENAYLAERIKELEAQLEAQDGNVADSDMANMEQRLREERQAAQPQQQSESLLSRYGMWLLGLLVLVAAAAGWRMSRRSGSVDAETGETIQEIKDEAEKVLRVLEDKEPEEPAAEAQPESAEEDEEATSEEPAEKSEDKPKTRAFGGHQEEADILDEESSDPEIQLDLARAYISMGDKEAARVILEEVASNGSEEQQAEAQKMLDLM
jgi:pilus assembly protein FimV